MEISAMVARGTLGRLVARVEMSLVAVVEASASSTRVALRSLITTIASVSF